jgi:hypothetical protein
MSVVPTHVFAEGERLMDVGLLQALRQAGRAVHVIHLVVNEEVAEARRAMRNTRFDRNTKCVARVIDKLRRFLSEADDFMFITLDDNCRDVTKVFKNFISDVANDGRNERSEEAAAVREDEEHGAEAAADMEHADVEQADVCVPEAAGDEEGVVREDGDETYTGDEDEGDAEIVGESLRQRADLSATAEACCDKSQAARGNPLVKGEIDEETRRTRKREECAASMEAMMRTMRKMRRCLDQPMDDMELEAANAWLTAGNMIADRWGV